jgi:uncharacterized membrane protein
MDNIYILFKVTLATGLLLLIPGYSFFLALFPRDNRYDTIQKLGISGILGLSVNLILGTIQTQIPNGVGLNLVIHLGVLAIISGVCIIVYLLRLRSISLDTEKIQQLLPKLRDLISTQWIPAIALAALFVIGTIIFLKLYPQPPENSFTEFYVLDSSKTIPFELDTNLPDNKISLIVGVVNQENRAVNYKIQAEQEGEVVSEPIRISLEYGDKWEDNITIDNAALHPDAGILYIVLYKDDLSTPYRKLHLVLPQNRD